MIKFIFFTCLLLLNLFTSNINAQDEFFEPTTSIGGYGELHLNNKTISNKSSNKLDFHRFIVFVSHSFSEKWVFKSEVELEHNLVGENKGELELEQAFIDYHFKDYLGFQAGVLLISAGIVNEYHEPPTFFGVERPEYHKYVIPTTWFGNGVALYGIYKGIDYKLTVTEGLNSDKFSAKNGIRDGRLKGFKANANEPLYNIRVNYLNLQNLLIGASFTYNNATGDSTNIPFSLSEIHFKTNINSFYFIGELGTIRYNSGNLKSSTGYYVDAGYNLKNLLEIDWDFVTFVRYTHYNINRETIGNSNSNETKKWMIGISIKPLDQIVLKADFAERTIGKSMSEKLLNIGIGYMF